MDVMLANSRAANSANTGKISRGIPMRAHYNGKTGNALLTLLTAPNQYELIWSMTKAKTLLGRVFKKK